MKVSLEVDDKGVRAKLTNVPKGMQRNIVSTVKMLTEKLRTHIVQDKLMGQVLHRVTGGLGQSIQTTYENSPTTTKGTVYSAGDVKYAAIHEFGGVINHPGGTAYFIDKKTGKAVFMSNTAAALIEDNLRTKPHKIPIPQRSFMRSSLKDMSDEISESIDKAVKDAIK